MKRLLPVWGGFLLLFCWILTPVNAAHAAVRADFRADVVSQQGKQSPQPCGTVRASGHYVRLDVQLGRAGEFSFILDEEAKRLSVLSLVLKAYVDIPVSGDARDWRELVKSVSAAVMPQSMGLMSAEEVERAPLSRGSWKGYAANRSRSVFQFTLMGSQRRVTMEVWENEAFAPLPLRVLVDETRETYASSAWLDNITAEQSGDAIFQIPDDFTRYTSVLDMVLYALSLF
ncbi:hypothetical protein [uncultured Mailhella sp.]|uniref:hypothetical protein n=1 Tax=uncultured Mailhella sp. TaxID=1981031 RepID=UPI002605CFED|nr:hypothetical protein [uncultured Mailhella sp.]